MKSSTRVSWLVIFCTLMLASIMPAFAMSDADKAVRGASEKVDTSFIVPTAQGANVMGRAQVLISQWNGYDRGMSVMKIETVTENLIETYNPTDIGNLGFNVTKTTLPEGDQISVSTMYYTGNIFSVGEDRKNANKRAHLLSYILQNYSEKLAETPTPAPMTTDTAPALPDDLEGYLKIIRSQLSEGKYDLALASLDGLKNVIADKQKVLNNVAPLTPSVVVPPTTAPIPPAPPTTLPPAAKASSNP